MALPEWLEPLYDAEQMRAIDRWAIEDRGVASLDLMERAGAGLAGVAERLAPDGPIAVVCGKGNNGGDGLVAARLLRESGREAVVVAAGDLEQATGDAAANLRQLPGPPPVALADVRLDDFGLAVDALLGTGFDGEPRGVVADAIEALNAARLPVVSADVPSGVDASTGAVRGAAVTAARTATFHAAKAGLWIAPGKQHAGEVDVIEIGIPRGAPEGAGAGLISPEVMAVAPRRGADSTKFASGHVLVVGGSRGLTGAPCMTSESAMRAGAGYVTACVPASLQSVFETRLLEVMTRGLADEDGALLPAGLDAVMEAAERGGALALGPGIGRTGGAFELARAVAARAPVPLVLDADGLNAHAGRLGSLRARPAPTVLTPHAGELGRLLEVDSGTVAAERLGHVREAAALSGAVVVLKGDDTLVADPDGRVAVSAGGSPALATAGTGDVLTGVVAALLAAGLEPCRAAAAGVGQHAGAGREAARRAGSAEGVIASDVIAALPAVREGGGAQ